MMHFREVGLKIVDQLTDHSESMGGGIVPEILILRDIILAAGHIAHDSDDHERDAALMAGMSDGGRLHIATESIVESALDLHDLLGRRDERIAATEEAETYIERRCIGDVVHDGEDAIGGEEEEGARIGLAYDSAGAAPHVMVSDAVSHEYRADSHRSIDTTCHTGIDDQIGMTSLDDVPSAESCIDLTDATLSHDYIMTRKRALIDGEIVDDLFCTGFELLKKEV